MAGLEVATAEVSQLITIGAGARSLDAIQMDMVVSSHFFSYLLISANLSVVYRL